MQWNSWCLHPEKTTYSTRTRLLQKCCWMYEGFRCIRDVWSKLKQMRFNERDSNLSGKCSHIIEQLLSSASSDTSADVSPNTQTEKMMNRGTVFVDDEWMHFSVCQYKHLQRLKTKLTLLAVITWSQMLFRAKNRFKRRTNHFSYSAVPITYGPFY